MTNRRAILAGDRGVQTDVEGAVKGGDGRPVLERGESGIGGIESKGGGVLRGQGRGVWVGGYIFADANTITVPGQELRGAVLSVRAKHWIPH